MFQYERIALDLKERISKGIYPTGRLPAERALSDEFQVQRDTVRSALELLVRDGILLRDSTRGTCIAPHLLPVDNAHTVAAQGAKSVLLIARTLEESAVSATIFRGLSNFLGTRGIPVYWHEPAEREPEHRDSERLDYLPSDDLLAERNVAGIAIWPRSWTPLERLRKLRETMPIVILDRRMPGFEADFVGYQDFEAGFAGTRHLMAMGHRRIGYLSGESWASTIQERISGYSTALREGTLAIRSRPAVLHQDGGSRNFDQNLIETFLKGNGDPLTAVLTGNDIIAARLIQHLRSSGQRVPEDLAIVGSGNLLPAMMDAFGLTTFGAPIEELGWHAGELLMRRIRSEADTAIREIEMPMPLIVRESCGAHRDAQAAPSPLISPMLNR